MRTCFLVVFLFVFGFNCSCSKENNSKRSLGAIGQPQETNDGWQTASISQAGIDSTKLRIMLNKIFDGTYQNIHSVLIIKNGKLVFEQYFPGYKFYYQAENFKGEYTNFTSHTIHNLASVTKSITSLLIGIAHDHGYIDSVETKMFNYFPEYASLNDSVKNQITLWHLLTMTSGLQWNEQDIFYSNIKNDIIQLFMVPDPVQFILSKPAIDHPGTKFNYNGGNTNLLGEIIQKTSGLMVDAFAKKHLFEPLGITLYEWVRINPDMVYTSGDLKLRPRDMAKIGFLILNKGVWKSKQIISSEWVVESTRPYVHFNTREGYGYQWWIKDYALGNVSVHSIAAMGWGGQNIIILPGMEAVVVVTAGNYATRSPNDEIIYRYILPSLNTEFKFNYEKIKNEAPIQESHNIIKPAESLTSSIANFSGHWYGRGDFSIADQLIVESIDTTEASILYSWGDHPQGYFKNGYIRQKAIIDNEGRLIFSFDGATLKFELDKYEDVLIGNYTRGDASSKLIMNRL